MAMSLRSQQRINWHHSSPRYGECLDRDSSDFQASPPPSTPLWYCRTPSLSDCFLSGRPCPLVTILSQCLPALHPPSSTGCATGQTVDKCIKVDSDYNWSLRINYTQWNSDNVIMQLTVDRSIYQDATGGRTGGWTMDRLKVLKRLKHYTTLKAEGRRGKEVH